MDLEVTFNDIGSESSMRARDRPCGFAAKTRLLFASGARASRLRQDFQIAGVASRVVLESLVRNCDGQQIRERQVRDLAGWQPRAPRNSEIPFKVGRIVLNCAAGIPLLGDLTAIRGAVKRLRASGRQRPGRPSRSIWCSITPWRSISTARLMR